MNRWIKWLIVIGAAALLYEVARRATESEFPFDLELDDLDVDEIG